MRKSKIGVLVILSALCISNLVIAEEYLGNVTVYVKDQDGDNVIDNSHLVGNLTVELWYEGQKVNTTVFSEGDDFVIFKFLNHTGLYTVRSIAYLSFTDYECSSAGCLMECSSAWNYTSGTTLTSVDHRGVYTCIALTFDEYGYPTYFNQKHDYLVKNDILTYISEGESDTAQVTMPTDKGDLGKYGYTLMLYVNQSGNLTTINVRNITGYEQKTDMYYAVGKDIYSSGLSEIIDQGTEDAIKGEYGRGMLSSGTATFIQIGTTEPENLFTEETGYRVVGSSLSSLSGGIATKVALLSGAPSGPAFVIGVVVEKYGSLTVDNIIDQVREAKVCEHAETDDFLVYLGNENQTCNVNTGCHYNTKCLKYPVAMVNQGEILHHVAVGADYDTLPFICATCLKFDPYSPEEMSTGEIHENEITVSYYDECYSIFNGTGRLHHELEFLPRKYCNFDTPDILFLVNSDVPPLSQLQTSEPYISVPYYPEYAYPQDMILISSDVVEDKQIDTVNVDWSINELDGEAIMETIGTGMHAIYGVQLPIPDSIGEFRFKIIANDTDGNSGTNDNDQRMYSIKVVEDAGSGGDAPELQQDALDISGLSSGEELSAYLLPERGDGYDWYKFWLEMGQPFSIGFNTSDDAKLFVYNDAEIMDFLDGKNYTELMGVGTKEGYAFILVKSRSSENEEYEFYVETYPETILPFDKEKDTSNIFKPLISSVFECGNGEFGHDCAPLQTGSIAQAGIGGSGAEITSIGDNHIYGLHPGDVFSIVPVIMEDCNGDEKTYIRVNVSFYGDPFSVYKINPIVREPDEENETYPCDSVSVGRTLNSGEVITAKVPLIKNGNDFITSYAVNMELVGPLGSIKTQEIRFNISLGGIPELENISVQHKFNGMEIKVFATDSDLDWVEIYSDGNLLVNDSFIGTYTHLWNTSGLDNGSSYEVYAKVFDNEGNWAESERITVTVRNDFMEPNILSALILPVNGEVHGNNVSGEVIISASAFDSETGIEEVRWYRNGGLVGSESSVTVDTAGLADGIHQIRLETVDEIGNLGYLEFPINVDNTAPDITGVDTGDSPIRDMTILNVTASDDGAGIEGVEWFIDDDGWRKVGSHRATMWGTAGLDGAYPMMVNVTDRVGNTASYPFSVNILNSADLWPYVVEVEDVAAGEVIVVDVTVFNLGYRDADGFDVEFRVDGGLEGVQSLSLAPMQNSTLQFNWTAVDGVHEIMVEVDSGDVIQEGYEGDNLEGFLINVSAVSGCSPPASGDWTISQFTECFSQQIALSGGSLLLYDDLELEDTSVTTDKIVFKDVSKITLKEASVKLQSG